MLIGGLLAGLVGITLGATFKITALLAVSGTVPVMMAASMILLGWTLRDTLVTGAIILAVLQSTYLAGTFLMLAARKIRR